MNVLITGAVGFIGMHTALRLLQRGDSVLGIDNLNAYYDPALKRARLALLQGHAGFRFSATDIADRSGLEARFREFQPDRVVHLAAQAGVRYSISHPQAYGDSNLVGFLNVLEACRQFPVAHLVYASSSSVYGGNRKLPFSELDAVDHPVSLYAATKKANELMAHSYSHLFRLPTTGLRFFTVYGPWGRPDMAYFSFTRDILAGQPIEVFNQGQMRRDFTYIDDIVDGVVATLDKAPTPDGAHNPLLPLADRSDAPYRVFNIGNQQPVMLDDFIGAIEHALGKSAIRLNRPMQPGDVLETEADVSALEAWTGLRPATGLAEGMARFVSWYRSYHVQPGTQAP